MGAEEKSEGETGGQGGYDSPSQIDFDDFISEEDGSEPGVNVQGLTQVVSNVKTLTCCTYWTRAVMMGDVGLPASVRLSRAVIQSSLAWALAIIST